MLSHIQEYVAASYSYKDCAILYRTNSQSDVFKVLFEASRIPYKVVDNSGFNEQPEIPDIKNEKKDAVSMMTIHSSKGLEFPIVFLVGVQEGTNATQKGY